MQINAIDYFENGALIKCRDKVAKKEQNRAITFADLVSLAKTLAALNPKSVLLDRLEGVIDTDPYCIIHTSGSTGIPKGVALSHRCTIDFVDWAFDRLSLDGSEVMGSLAPIYFDAYTLEFCLCLAKGATWMVVPDQLAMFPPKLVEFVANNPINFIFWVPTIMVNIANLDLLAKIKLDRLKKIF